MPSEEIVINSTLDEIERFRESPLWADIVRELTSWSEGFNREMGGIVEEAATTNPSTASVLLHMGDLNGRQKAVLYFLSLLDMFEELKKEQAKDAKAPNQSKS